MNKELEKKLMEYAQERANDVYDIDMDQLKKLVIDGAKWMLNEYRSNEEERNKNQTI